MSPRPSDTLLTFALGMLGCSSPLPSEQQVQTRANRTAIAHAWQPLIWGGEQKLVASDGAELDEFGISVALSEERIIVGAYGEDSFTGAAYVFVRDGNGWREEQKLVASDRAHGDEFGRSVSITAERAIVGAPGSGYYRGAAYVFVDTGDTWVEEQKLVNSDGADLDQFGWSTSLISDRALVGAHGHHTERGAAYVFLRSGNRWNEEQKLVASDALEGDHLGYAVSLGNERALVGAPADDDYRGAGYVFTRNADSWSQEQKLLASDGADFSQFGASVALDADRALLGSYWADEFLGAAYVFFRDGTHWTEEQKLVASEAASGDRFGNAVSLSQNRALIGAVGTEDNRGAAYVFSLSDGAWHQEQRLLASDGVGFDLFAWSVALHAERALLGANYTDQLRGAVYALTLGLAQGEACAMDVECASGHCIEQRCCDDACGPCGACSVAKGALADGHCSPLPAGASGGPVCAPLACNGQSPRCEPCEADTDCLAGQHCAADQTCQLGQTLGTRCDSRAGADCFENGCHVCQSGFCADGVCCDTDCAGLCSSCRATLTGGEHDGVCAPIEAGNDPEGECRDDGALSCAVNGLCDGAGGCQRYPIKANCKPEACIRGDDCTSGHCEDGICCDRVCGPSERCRAELKLTGPDGECGAELAAALGAACAFDVQCTSGHCASGVCSIGGREAADAGHPEGTSAQRSAEEDSASCACHTGTSRSGAVGYGSLLLSCLLLVHRRIKV